MDKEERKAGKRCAAQKRCAACAAVLEAPELLQLIWCFLELEGSRSWRLVSRAFRSFPIKIKELDLSSIPHIGDPGLASLADACASGALAQLTLLDLRQHQIGDAGLASLSGALASGALAQLKELYLDENQIGEAGVTALAQAIKPVSEGGSRALAQLTCLDLSMNQIGDPGLASLADACARGALAQLTELWLGWPNQIGDAGVTSLSDALANRALAQLEILWIDPPSEQLRAHCSSKGIKLNRFDHTRWDPNPN